MKNALDILKERGFVKQTVYEDDLYKLLGSGRTLYPHNGNGAHAARRT